MWKYRRDESNNQKFASGAELVFTPSPWRFIAGARNVLCADNKRRVAYASGHPDTMSTVPARVRVDGKTVTGFILTSNDDDVLFTPNAEGKNCRALPTWLEHTRTHLLKVTEDTLRFIVVPCGTQNERPNPDNFKLFSYAEIISTIPEYDREPFRLAVDYIDALHKNPAVPGDWNYVTFATYATWIDGARHVIYRCDKYAVGTEDTNG